MRKGGSEVGWFEDTNRLILDLERRLSVTSSVSTSSNQTHQSQNSSVVMNQNLSGLGKQGVQNNVLRFGKPMEDGLNTNSLFRERQEVILKRKNSIDKHKQNIRSKYEREGTRGDRIGHKDGEDGLTPQRVGLNFLENFDEAEEYESFDENELEEERGYYEHEFGDYDGDDYLYDEEEGEDLLLPPSPPRSPPLELDPDKLYGLYDFSGPDPSHCTLTRNEPVYLLNDEDSYWWLIRKLSKQERADLLRRRAPDRNTLVHSDDEDGKIGFVPAECLETHEERLARLNCFRNEELERNYRDEQFYGPVRSNGYVLSSQKSIEGGSRKKSSDRKAVTFDVASDVDSLEDSSFENEFGQQIHVSREELGRFGHHSEEDKASDAFSDIYPDNTQLVINKKSRKDVTGTGEAYTTDLNDGFVKTTDLLDTWTLDNDHGSDTSFLNPYLQNQALFNALTTDRPSSPELVRSSEYKTADDQSAAPPTNAKNALFSHDNSDLQVSLENMSPVILKDSVNFKTEPHTKPFEHSINSKSTEKINDLESDVEDEDEDDYNSTSIDNRQIYQYHDEVTPLTSINSLSLANGNSSSSAQDLVKNEFESIQDSYLPVLDRLDRLADKIAELEDLI